MASRYCDLEDELSCPMCGYILREPVVLSCRHRFCKVCLEDSWGPNGEARDCPLCYRRSSLEQLLVSPVLERACQTFRAEKRQRDPLACGEHGERLTLFCLEELLPVCDICRSSPKHSTHNLYPLEDAAQDCKVSQAEDLPNASPPLTTIIPPAVLLILPRDNFILLPNLTPEEAQCLFSNRREGKWCVGCQALSLLIKYKFSCCHHPCPTPVKKTWRAESQQACSLAPGQ